MCKKITICTPTFNRAYCLHRPYKSLCKQTNKNFKWLIIDDGSTDNTEQVVNNFFKEGILDIEYHRKENGGRHTALNYSYRYIDTEWVANLDSDDEYLPEAVDIFINAINSIPDCDYERFWQISARALDSKTGKIIGPLYPAGINHLTGRKQRVEFLKITGEKSNCRKTEILRKYLFPTFADTNFITENIVWEKIGKEYDSFCINLATRYYYQNSPDSLSKFEINDVKRAKSRYYYTIFCLKDLGDQFWYNRNVRRAPANLIRMSKKCGIPLKEVLAEMDFFWKKLLIILCYPIGDLYYKYEKRK